jgi:phenylacetate-CoA ligase
MFVRNSSIDVNKSTLVLVCFGMGVWIGGVITYQAFKAISERGYPMTILTPGVNKREIFEALKNIGPKYDQVIMCGYPPFMKDVVDEAKLHGINWHHYNVKMVFAAEAFSEKFREYIMRKVGMKNPYRDTMNIYGSADLGTMASETPFNSKTRS